MVQIPSLEELTGWICYTTMLIGLITVWIDFWVGVFYSSFGFGVIYLILRRADRNNKFMYLASRREQERTHGVG
jgi:hypothetical protein